MSDPSMSAPSTNGMGSQVKVGKVVDNNDPKKLSRVRVRIAEMFDGIPDNHLPWAIPVVAHVSGATSTSGTVDIPVIGSKVLVEFQNGSALHPKYGAYYVDESTKLEEAETNYPDRRVFLFQSGTMILLDDKTEEIFIRLKGTSNIYVTGDCNMQVDGNMVQKIKGNRTTFIGGNDITVVGGTSGTFAATLNLKASGTLCATGQGQATLYSGGMLYLKGSNLDMQNSGSDSTGSAPSQPALPAWTGIRSPVPS